MSRMSPPTIALDLRRERNEDHRFLYGLYASTRETELAQVMWSAREKQEFLRLQFDAQRKHYARQSTTPIPISTSW